MIVGEHAFGFWFVINSIGAFAHIYLLDEGERRRVEHRDFILTPVTGKAMLEGRGNRSPVHARRVRNRADWLPAVSVKNFDLGPVRNIEPPRRAINRYVIKATDA